MDSEEEKSDIEKQIDATTQRLEILAQLDDMTTEHIKTIDLFIAKGIETIDHTWIKRGDLLHKEFLIKRDILEKKYEELGGKRLKRD